MNAPNELDRLIQAYLDEILTEEEAVRMRELLKTREDAMDAFVRAMDLHAGLADRWAKGQVARRTWVRPALIAASLFIGMAVLWGVFSPRPPAPNVTRSPLRKQAEPPQEVATPQLPKEEPAVEVVVEDLPEEPLDETKPPEPLVVEAEPLPIEEEVVVVEPPVVEEEPAPAPTTQAAVAVVEDTDAPIPAGGDVETTTLTVVKWPDGTRLELRGDTRIENLRDEKGKRLHVARGTVVAEVAKQRKPMVFTTPHGEATVLGTTLSLMVDPASTRLEVEEGRVRIKPHNGQSGVITSGFAAIVDRGPEITLRPMAREPKSPMTWEFDRDGDLEGWTPGTHIASLSVKDGVLEGESVGIDPQLLGPVMAKSAAFRKVTIRILNDSPSREVELLFTTEADPKFDGLKAKYVTLRPNARRFMEYTFDMSSVPGWKGTVTRLRLDPINGEGRFKIDWIRMER